MSKFKRFDEIEAIAGARRGLRGIVVAWDDRSHNSVYLVNYGNDSYWEYEHNLAHPDDDEVPL